MRSEANQKMHVSSERNRGHNLQLTVVIWEYHSSPPSSSNFFNLAGHLNFLFKQNLPDYKNDTELFDFFFILYKINQTHWQAGFSPQPRRMWPLLSTAHEENLLNYLRSYLPSVGGPGSEKLASKSRHFLVLL